MPVVAYDSGTGAFERRIGKRVRTDLADVELVERPAGEGRRSPEPRSWPGEIEDVSVTGAAVLGPDDLPMAVGDRAVLRYRGSDSGVTICRAEPTDRPGVVRYGVEFAVLHPRLKDHIYQLLSRGRPDEASWHLAH